MYPRLHYPAVALAGLHRPGDVHQTWLVPPLDGAVVKRIAPGGMVIVRQECVVRGSGAKDPSDRYPQAWWCVFT